GRAPGASRSAGAHRGHACGQRAGPAMKPMRPVWLAAATWLASCLVGPASPAFGAGARGVATATVVPAEAIGSPAVDEILEQFKPLIELTPPANGMPLRLPVFSGGGGAGAGGEGGAGGGSLGGEGGGA